MELDTSEADVRLFTYGVKYDRVPLADLYFDCQVFTDPGCLHKLTGKDEQVQNFLKQKFGTSKRQGRAFNNIVKVVSAVAGVHKLDREMGVESEPMLIGLFCFGGRHRSVGVSEMLKRLLEEKGLKVELAHLDILRKKKYAYVHEKAFHGEVRTSDTRRACEKI